ncbi:NADH dehydrogenase [Aureimonas ureilytica]|uniref:NADH dehydrogenase n=1 Tax=Aureimonas ureilytica TaxID=401562 RepID=A0A175RNC1_9HYPH|nr:FAD-dependent oxidoreductase [Aureimonas ureilytica]KTR04444.1 NADH dehydrogenase [Aureimonas ureilytica]
MAGSTAHKRIVILGGGSGGLELASQLAGKGELEVVLVDRELAHLWKPRLHEFAAGTVSSSLAEMSFYMLGHLRGFRFEQGEVSALDHDRREIVLAAIPGKDGTTAARERRIPYDVCVVALGGVVPDFGTTGVKEFAVRLDTKSDADHFRDRFIAAMIEARESGEPAEVVIVGSGATGTELAAHLRRSERGFFDQSTAERRRKLLGITILEAAPEIMPGAEPELRQQLAERLRRLDIKTVTDVNVSRIEVDAVSSKSGERWPCDLAVWAAGLVGNPILKRLGRFEIDNRGRIVVDQTLRSSLDEHVYAMGDAASLTPPGADKPLPPTAQAASQQADYLVEVLPLIARGEPVEPFRYADKGRIVSLGRAGTVGMIGFGKKDDFLIHGHFATAAYNALQRQHQWRVLGRLRGTVSIAADMISPTKGPALKLHGD